MPLRGIANVCTKPLITVANENPKTLEISTIFAYLRFHRFQSRTIIVLQRMSAPGGVSAGGCLLWGCLLQGGVCSGGCLLRGVSAPGGV